MFGRDNTAPLSTDAISEERVRAGEGQGGASPCLKPTAAPTNQSLSFSSADSKCLAFQQLYSISFSLSTVLHCVSNTQIISQMSSLSGKVAVVAGSTRGIGRAIALHLARSGASLALLYNSDVAKAQQVRVWHFPIILLPTKADPLPFVPRSGRC